ncbi:TetR/AcrR family transcriptional regulator [Dactylosporangium sp. AC04546]|uniref:TetR/AcrR family transcriptional regulator n=1 Tax=Dactylosporangium sp. AC04546 TaxID=2862460 RepID=UPI001EDEB691|nr:TetR family transcriptional regulator [Dactylosporangium sp. AC04546]WVK82624.1 TetR/AcrR family transcriptional regulator [Dactylosporangium sp. AC04546]
MPETTRPIWSRPDRGARGPQPEHSRAEIAQAAMRLADAGGLEAATMRAVAGELGTAAASLYRYLSSRDDLLDLMIDAALGELRLDGPPSGDWLEDLVALAHQQLALYRRHPWLMPAALRRGAFGPRAMDYFEYCLRTMAPLPCGTAAKMEAVGVLTGLVTMFAAQSVAQSATPHDPAALFAAATPQAHPYLLAALATPGPPPQPDLFDRLARNVLRGLLAP